MFKGRRAWLKALLVTGLFISIAAFLVLRYGNCQWHRCIFIFQRHYYPCRVDSWADNFTGEWVGWHSNGRVWFKLWIENGEETDKTTEWFEDGQLTKEHNEKTIKSWYRSGKPHYLGLVHPEHGALTRFTRWLEDGNVEDIREITKTDKSTIYQANKYFGPDGNLEECGMSRISLAVGSRSMPKKVGKWRCLETYKDKRSTTEKYYLDNAEVTESQYMAACDKDASLPKMAEVKEALAKMKPLPYSEIAKALPFD